MKLRYRGDIGISKRERTGRGKGKSWGDKNQIKGKKKNRKQ
jgi:hypothetical protein